MTDLANFTIYQTSGLQDLDATTLNQALAQLAAKPCTGQIRETYGFDYPPGLAEQEQFVFESGGFLMLLLLKHERVIPSPVIKDAVAAKVSAIKSEQSRKVGSKEKEEIKEQVIFELLPKAFTKKTYVAASIDTQNSLLYVHSANIKLAEDLLGTLRSALGSLSVVPLQPRLPPEVSFTAWLSNQSYPANFIANDDCELRDPDNTGSVIKFKGENLDCDEIKSLIESGKQVTQLALTWKDDISFNINNKMQVRRLAFSQSFIKNALADSSGKNTADFAANYSLAMLTMRELVPVLLDALGGEKEVV